MPPDVDLNGWWSIYVMNGVPPTSENFQQAAVAYSQYKATGKKPLAIPGGDGAAKPINWNIESLLPPRVVTAAKAAAGEYTDVWQPPEWLNPGDRGLPPFGNKTPGGVLAEQNHGGILGRPGKTSGGPQLQPHPGGIKPMPDPRQMDVDRRDWNIYIDKKKNRIPGRPNDGPGMPQFPEFENIPVFNGEYGDFTGEAAGRTGRIFDPYYTSLNQSRERGKQDYSRYDATTKSMFDQLAADTANYRQQGIDLGSQLAGQQQAGGTAAVDQIAQGAASSNQDNAAYAQALGVEGVAPTVSEASEESNWQQGQLALQNSTNLNSLNQTTAADADYLSRMGVAGNSRGVERRGELINQLADYLATVDQYDASAHSQQAAQTQSLADTLAQQDWDRQVTGYNANKDRVIYGNQNEQNEYNNEYGVYSDEYERRMKNQQLSIDAEANRINNQPQPADPTPMGKWFNGAVSEVGYRAAADAKGMGDQFAAGLDLTGRAQNGQAVWRAATDEVNRKQMTPDVAQAFLSYVQWLMANGVLALQNQPTSPSTSVEGGFDPGIAGNLVPGYGMLGAQ